MAKLTLTVGTQSAEITMPDAAASILINDIVGSTGGPVEGMAKQRGLWVLKQIGEHLRMMQRNAIHVRKETTVRVELDAELEAAGKWVEV